MFSYYVHQKGILFDLRALLRDILIYLATLLFLVYIFWDYRITIVDSTLLTLTMAIYFLYLSRTKEESNTNSSGKISVQ